ncbi:MAG TPA: peptidyl-tRNA hydrolase [Pseudonocardiaceae bacterium]|jgi:peptidyl-tRNA hydrolase|nr:peptidyl-tRNA hydrolase [Pseudonocardiaceae bacterium]
MTSAQIHPVLAPLAARYTDWLALPNSSTVDTSDEQPDQVRAMPVVLRIEKAQPPNRTALLEAAAAAAVAVCLDERAEQDGPWHADLMAWTGGRIRKVARRARGAHWVAAQEFPGRTVDVHGAQARALVPGLVTETPKEISRLQIAGSDLPIEPDPAPPAGRPVLWLNPEVPMTAGKAAAQVGHGTMLLAALLSGSGRAEALAEWSASGFRCAVRIADKAAWPDLCPGQDPERSWRERGIIAVRDAGFTEVAPGTITVLAQWPQD